MRHNFLARVARFARKMPVEQVASVRARFRILWRALLPSVPMVKRLSGGGWWLVHNDVVGDAVFSDTFELSETAFVKGFLRPGMTVLDIGANAGYYTLLASRAVGLEGRVIAFEPSPRERQKLLTHTRLNRCSNVKVESLALSNREGTTVFFVVQGRETGCNSIKQPDVKDPVQSITVPMTTLGRYLEDERIARVDFIKLDVEGAELEVLRGAEKFFRSGIRPVLLCELEAARTRPWGYEPEEIMRFLSAKGFRWLGLDTKGSLVPIERRASYNFVAVPEEKFGVLISKAAP